MNLDDDLNVAPLIYRPAQVEKLLNIKRTAREDLERRGDLKAAIRLGPKSKGYLAADVHDFLRRRVAERDAERDASKAED